MTTCIFNINKDYCSGVENIIQLGLVDGVPFLEIFLLFSCTRHFDDHAHFKPACRYRYVMFYFEDFLVTCFFFWCRSIAINLQNILIVENHTNKHMHPKEKRGLCYHVPTKIEDVRRIIAC